MRPPLHPDHLDTCGIHALARAGERNQWFLGHIGAAMLAGAELLRRPELPDHAKGALAAAVDRLETNSPDWYTALDADAMPNAGATSTDRLLEALRTHAGQLRTSGHGTIYLVAALRAFRRAPHLASERTVAGIAQLHADSQDDDPDRYLGHADYTAGQRARARDASLDRAAGASFRACEQRTPDIVRDGKRYFLFGEKIHVLTHLHALHQLEALGQSEIAHAGLAAHELQLELSHVPAQEHQPVPAGTALTPSDAAFWEFDGDDVWHKLKLAEAALTLLPRLVPDERADAERVLAGMWSMLGVPAA